MDDKNKLIDRAQKLAQKGYIDRAIDEYQKILEDDPKDATIRLRIGDLYVRLGQNEDAIKEYTDVAKLYTRQGFNLRAIAVYKQILKLDEGLIEIHYKLADLYSVQKLIADAIAELSIVFSYYEKKDRFNEVVSILKEMLIIAPQNIGVRLKLAEYYYKKSFINEAMSEYGIALKSFIKEGKLEKAEKLYLSLYPDNQMDIKVILEGLVEIYRLKGENINLIKYYKELADIYEGRGESEKRKEVYEKIIEISPNDEDAINILGRKPLILEEPSQKTTILVPPPPINYEPEPVKEEEPKEEISMSWDVLPELEQEIKPNEVAPFIDIKEMPCDEEEIQLEDIIEEITPEPIEIIEELPIIEEVEHIEAIQEIEKPSDIKGLGLEGLQLEGAIVVGEAAPPTEENYIDISTELGLEDHLDFLSESWTQGEKDNEIFKEFKDGMEKLLSSEDTETHYNMGIAYMEMGLYDNAIREFKIALKDQKFEFDCYTLLGLSLMRKEDYKEAINSFLKGLQIKGRTDEERKGLMYELGLAYEAANNNQEALEVFKSIYTTDSSFREVFHKVEKLTEDTTKGEFIPLMDDVLEVELLP